jgi:uncharacterized membrane protein YgcG
VKLYCESCRDKLGLGKSFRRNSGECSRCGIGGYLEVHDYETSTPQSSSDDDSSLTNILGTAAIIETIDASPSSDFSSSSSDSSDFSGGGGDSGGGGGGHPIRTRPRSA